MVDIFRKCLNMENIQQGTSFQVWGAGFAFGCSTIQVRPNSNLENDLDEDDEHDDDDEHDALRGGSEKYPPSYSCGGQSR